ncbi:MAG: LysR family transcriptional regulator [Sneathiella sp.]
MINTEIQELEIFVAVVKHGNFSKASEELSIAASVVSRSVKKLEDKLKVTLFNRTTRKINLTQEGEWLFQHAIEILQKVSTVENHLKKAQERPQGTLRIDAASAFTLHAIAPIIAGFNQKFDQIDIVLTSTDSVIDLIERNIDVAIRIGELSDSTLKAKKIGNCYRKIYASPEYIKTHEPISKVSDVSSHICLGFTKPDKLNTWPVVTQTGGYLEVIPEIEADSGETIKQLAIHGSGLACISSFTADQDVQDGRLVCVLKEETQPIPIPVNAVFYSDNETSGRVRCFLDFLAEHVRF